MSKKSVFRQFLELQHFSKKSGRTFYEFYGVTQFSYHSPLPSNAPKWGGGTSYLFFSCDSSRRDRWWRSGWWLSLWSIYEQNEYLNYRRNCIKLYFSNSFMVHIFDSCTIRSQSLKYQVFATTSNNIRLQRYKLKFNPYTCFSV